MKLEATPLWQAFAAKADDAQRAQVRQLTEHAAGILDRITETFPTYTLHNHVHALNVVRLMGDLIGDCERLTGLEAALLILAAYFHDIGMYYRPEERESLAEDEHFDDFLREHSEAYIEYREHADTVTPGLAEWFCRWRHADRVYEFLNQFSDDDLSWEVVPLREKLGEICRSHNQDLAHLKDDQIFETDFVQKADIRFCAIALRLADILDFDRSRSPEFVYRYLGFAHGDSAQLRRSNAEWHKHLRVQGFSFPPPDRNGPYALPVVASPDDPTVEHDIRAFLDVIDDELKGCATVLGSCSPRWRDLPLPDRIVRDIRPRGYAYGDYKFNLDRHQVLNLFMGENLYANAYVFIRELLQNAIDTTRHRVFFERNSGRTSFEPAAIDVTEWVDEEGFRWVRLDDYGMGMDEQLIRDYFLSVGRSYYQSADFRADLLRYTSRDSDSFTPISRFGIGVLSCFIVGDRVEVSTRRVRMGDTSVKPVRLSLRGLESFYILQTDPMPPGPMPSETGAEHIYRPQPGTSIAIRLDPAKDPGEFDLASLLRRYLLASPVPVTQHGEPVPTAFAELVATPWFEGERLLPIPIPNNFRGGPFFESSEFDALALPLDLTAVSPDPRFRGQMVLLALRYTAPPYEVDDSGYITPNSPPVFQTSLIRKGRWLLSYAYESDVPDLTIDLASLFGTPVGQRAAEALQTPLGWSHNGVALPGQVQSLVDEGEILEVSVPVAMLLESSVLSHRTTSGTFTPPSPSEGVSRFQLVGCWSFTDELRLDVSASRDVTRGLPWHIRSLIQYTASKACANTDHEYGKAMLSREAVLLDFEFIVGIPILGIILSDPIFAQPEGWSSFALIELRPQQTGSRNFVTSGRRTVATIHKMVQDGDEVRPALPSFTNIARNRPEVDFSGVLSAALLRTSTVLGWTLNQERDEWQFQVIQAEPLPVSDGEKALPPLYLLPYVGHDGLRVDQGPLNRDHPLSQWLLEAVPALKEQHPSLLGLLLQNLSDPYAPGEPEVAERVFRVNGILDRLRQQNFSPRPSSQISLTVADFA